VDTVKEIRRRKGWSQKDLAEESGVGQDTISGIESGRHEPRPSTLRKLADALDVEVADFFREPAVPLAKAPREAGPPDPRVQERREFIEHIKTLDGEALQMLVVKLDASQGRSRTYAEFEEVAVRGMLVRMWIRAQDNPEARFTFEQAAERALAGVGNS